jgi:hypothetical protein
MMNIIYFHGTDCKFNVALWHISPCLGYLGSFVIHPKTKYKAHQVMKQYEQLSGTWQNRSKHNSISLCVATSWKHCERAMFEMINADIHGYSSVMLKYIFPLLCNVISRNKTLIKTSGSKQHTSCNICQQTCCLCVSNTPDLNFKKAHLSFQGF